MPGQLRAPATVDQVAGVGDEPAHQRHLFLGAPVVGSPDALPDGLDTAIGELGGGVSGGQRQRIALARALLRGAPVLVLDEVTSDLDAATEAEVAASLRALAPERTLIFIAHRPATALMADRVFVVDQGRVVEEGAPANLEAAGGPFAKLMARAG